MDLNFVLIPSPQFDTECMVFTSALAEYLCAEILSTSGNNATAWKKESIEPMHVHYAIIFDTELMPLFRDFVDVASSRKEEDETTELDIPEDDDRSWCSEEDIGVEDAPDDDKDGMSDN